MIKKRFVTLSAILAMMAVPCWIIGYGTEKISHVSIRLEAEGFNEWGEPELSAFTKGNHYSAGEVISAADYYGLDKGDEETANLYVIELDAEDGYYFNITKSDRINFNGLGAEFVKASRQNNGLNLYVTVRLTGVGNFVDEIEDAKWEPDGRGSWSEAYGAKIYTIYFFDEKGKIKRTVTEGTSYDFRPYMQKSGNYSFQVRPVSSTGKGNEWTEAGTFLVTEDMAEENRRLFEVEKEVIYKDGIKSPSNQVVTYKNVGWQQAEDGRYWFRNMDASYPQSIWMEDHGDWYYFDRDGYVLTDQYLEQGGKTYYLKPDGRMLVNGKAPDGREADEDGKLFIKK